MAGRWKGEMKPSAMLDNIRNQPFSLELRCGSPIRRGRGGLQAAAEAIRAAGRVVFTGMGSSMSAAIPAAYYLQSRGFAAEVVETSEWLHFGAGWPRTEAAVMVSRSGETIEIVEASGPAERTTVATDHRGNQCARNSAGTRSRARHLHQQRSRPHGGHSNLHRHHGHAVAAWPRRCWKSRTTNGARQLNSATGVLSASGHRRSRSRRAKIGMNFWRAPEVVHLLGRGPSLASVREGALLFNEAARTPSAGLSCALFRHGPVEIVDQRFSRDCFRFPGRHARDRSGAGVRYGAPGWQNACIPGGGGSIAL